MSLDFNRHPHLVNTIEVFPVTDLPSELDDSTKLWLNETWETDDDFRRQVYFRYQHANPTSPLVEGAIESIIPYTDYGGGVYFWSRFIAQQARLAVAQVVECDAYAGNPIVRVGINFDGSTAETKRNAQLAIAGALGYYPGFDMLELKQARRAS